MVKFGFIFLLLGANLVYSYVYEGDGEIDSEEYGQYAGVRSTNCSCGYTYKPDGRIVNGRESQKNEFPYMVALVKASTRGWGQFCGASIITPHHALTAAHCTHGERASNLALLAGEHDLSSATETRFTRIYPLAYLINHERYDTVTTANDIALLVTRSRMTFNEAVGPICLPKAPINLEGQYVKVTGWGALAFEGKSSSTLMKVNLKVVSIQSCSNAYGSSSVSARNPTQFCTYGDNKDSCQGDSGGPVAWLDPETNRYTLVGLVSFGYKCATQVPGVNTDVYSYIDWVQHNIARTTPYYMNLKTCAKV